MSETGKKAQVRLVADLIASHLSYKSFEAMVTTAPESSSTLDLSQLSSCLQDLSEDLSHLEHPRSDLAAALAQLFSAFQAKARQCHGHKILTVIFDALKLVANSDTSNLIVLLADPKHHQDEKPIAAPQVTSSNSLIPKDNTESVALDYLKQLNIQPAVTARQLSTTIWQLRCGLGHFPSRPRVLVTMLGRLVSQVFPNLCDLPKAYLLPVEPLDAQAAQAQLDEWVKKFIAPQVSHSDLPYMIFLLPFFELLPEESDVSLSARLANLEEMRLWAEEVFNITPAQATVLSVLNKIDPTSRRHETFREAFQEKKIQTAKELHAFCVKKKEHVGASGKDYPKTLIGRPITAYTDLTSPLAVNAVKHNLDSKNTDEPNAKRSRVFTCETTAESRAGSTYDPPAGKFQQLKCLRCGRVNHETNDCVSAFTPKPGRCGKCASRQHKTAACNATELECTRCRSKGHKAICCRQTVTPARILRGEDTPLDSALRILRVDPENEKRFLVNTISNDVKTEVTHDNLLAEICLQNGLDPNDMNHLPAPVQALLDVTTVSLNALSTENDLPPEIRSRIDGPLTSLLEYASVEFQHATSGLQKVRGHATHGLCDSGATVNVVSPRCVAILFAKQVITPKDIYQMPNFSLTVANSKSAHCPGILLATISSYGKAYRGGFCILENLQADLIIGKPGLSQLFDFRGFTTPRIEPHCVFSLEHSLQQENTEVTDMALRMTPTTCTVAEHTEGRTPWISEVYEGESRMLQVNFPLMEKADVEPHVEPPRRKSKNEDRIIQVLVDHMIAAGKLAVIPSSEALITLPIVLVDKLAHEVPRPPPITDSTDTEAILSRHRFCIDSRVTNQLELQERNGRLIYVAPKSADIKNSPAHAPYQYQTGAYELLSRMPATAQYFARVDIKNAFYGVRLHPDLCRLFCFEVHNWDTGQTKTYKMRVLPQGWRWSPLFFRKVSQYIVDKLNQKLRELHPDLSESDIYTCFLQDDIVLAGRTLELTEIAQGLLMDILTSYSFQVNRAKSLPPSETLEFCGYLLSRGLVTPTATRRSVTLAFADTAWTTYLKLKPQARLKWFHSIAGTFHFSRQFLNADCALNLRIIYDHIRLLNEDPLSTFDTSVVKDALYALVAFLNLGLPPAILYHFNKVYATILVTDANIKAWSAQLFYLVDAPSYNANLNDVLPDVADLTKRLTAAQGFPAINVPDTAILVPVRMAADIFTKTEQVTSSTTRERYAQLAAVDELFELFYGPVVLINDNQNSLKNWHAVDRLFVGRRADQFNRFQQHVHAVAWLPRESNLATLVDELARLRENLVATANTNTNTDTNTDATAVVATLTTSVPPDERLPTNSSREVISLLPAVPVVESHPIDPVVYSTMSEHFPSHYLTDRSQEHRGINMADICKHLFNPEDTVDPAVATAARRFTVMHNMVLWRNRDALRLYVPKFSYTGALAGNETLSSHTYLVLLAHFGHGAHSSPTRMEADLKRTFWWPNLKQDITQFANACVTCRQIRATHDSHRGTLGSPTEEADRPFRVWQMDFAEAPDRRGYILIFICAFSGYVISRKCNSSTHHHVLDTLWDQIIYVHGVPQRVHCDQGTHFTADAVKAFARRFAIHLTFGPAAHPRAQGMVEKAIGDVKKAYETVVATHDRIAPARALLIAAWQHNTHMHSRLGFTPYEIVHGFRNRSLLDLTLPRELERHLTEREQELRDIIHTLVQLRREDARAVYQEHYLASSHPSNIKIGDLVYKYIQAPVPGGHRTVCKGMYLVVRPASNTTWILSEDEWTPGRQWTQQDREAQYAVPDLQLRRVGDVGDYAGRVFIPPPAPAPLTRQDHLGTSHADHTLADPDSSVPRYSLRANARGGGDPGNFSTGGMS